MKAKDALKRMIEMMDGGKLSEKQVDGILNGAIINGEFIYKDGMVASNGKVQTFSADKMNSIKWPDVDIRKSPSPKP